MKNKIMEELTGTEKSENDVVRLCQFGIFPKLPFLIEEHDDGAFLATFFATPSEYPNVKGVPVTEIPASLAERQRILTLLLDRVKASNGKQWWRELHRKSRAAIILFLSENYDSQKAWTSTENSARVREICDKLVEEEETEVGAGTSKASSSPSLASWFSKNLEESLTPSESDFHTIVQLLKGKLTKSEWKHFPACAHGFGWILQQIPSPFLGFEIDWVIPPALLFTDDYFDDYKQLGLTCLSHIVKNVDKVDLTRSNWANVVYEAVYHLCSDKDPAVIKLAIPVLLKLLQIIEKDPAQNSNEFTKYDDLIKQTIFQLEISSDLELKKTWFPILNDILKLSGTASLHWSDRLGSLLRDSTICNDVSIWICILQLIATIIKNTWINVDSESMSETILRVLFNLSSFHGKSLKDAEKNELFQEALICFKLLQSCQNFKKIERQITEIIEIGDSNLLHPDFISTVKEVKLALNS